MASLSAGKSSWSRGVVKSSARGLTYRRREGRKGCVTVYDCRKKGRNGFVTVYTECRWRVSRVEWGSTGAFLGNRGGGGKGRKVKERGWGVERERERKRTKTETEIDKDRGRGRMKEKWRERNDRNR